MLRTVRTVIVDEIHAVIGTPARRAPRAVARAAAGARRATAPPHRPVRDAEADRRGRPVSASARDGECAIVDEGHRRAIDLAARDCPARRSKR